MRPARPRFNGGETPKTNRRKPRRASRASSQGRQPDLGDIFALQDYDPLSIMAGADEEVLAADLEIEPDHRNRRHHHSRGTNTMERRR